VADPASIAPAAFAPRRLPERTPLAGAARERVSPSGAAALESAAVTETVDLGDRVTVMGDDMTTIGTALHAVIAAELMHPGGDGNLDSARAILEGYGAGTFLDATEALGAARRFHDWIESRFEPKRVLVEHPIEHRLDDGRVVRGWIDVLLETEAGWVVIDHKSSPRPKSEWHDEALEHSGQLATYRRALEAAGERVAGCWIHFAVSGGAAEVEV
jgi:ATP-dependent helicase/nuclease subunit A